MEPQRQFSTSQAAQRLHVHPDTLKAWERDSLLPFSVSRTSGNHRRYSQAQLDLLASLLLDGSIARAAQDPPSRIAAPAASKAPTSDYRVVRYQRRIRSALRLLLITCALTALIALARWACEQVAALDGVDHALSASLFVSTSLMTCAIVWAGLVVIASPAAPIRIQR